MQAAWRGFVLRRRIAHDRQLAEIRERVLAANSAATEPMLLGNRTRSALAILLESTSTAFVRRAVKNLDTATGLSSVCCETIARDGAVPVLIELIRSCNRSRPNQDIVMYSLQILRNLAQVGKLCVCVCVCACVRACVCVYVLWHVVYMMLC